MRYKVALQHSGEGYAASVLGPPGRHSQGKTENEAIANITAAIREYLEVQIDLWTEQDVREIAVEA